MHEPEATAITSSITSSLVLAADDPSALAQFYGALLGAQPQPGLSAAHWRVPWPAGGGLEVYSPSRSRPQPRQPGRLALCLQRKADGPGALAVLQAWISTALELGASVGIRRGRNRSAPRPGCWIRRAIACCCWCCPEGWARLSPHSLPTSMGKPFTLVAVAALAVPTAAVRQCQRQGSPLARRAGRDGPVPRRRRGWHLRAAG